MRRVDAAGAPVITDSGNFLVDAHLGSIPDPLVIDRELNWIPGVVENGLFTGLADEVIFADPQGTITVMRLRVRAGRPPDHHAARARRLNAAQPAGRTFAFARKRFSGS